MGLVTSNEPPINARLGGGPYPGDWPNPALVTLVQLHSAIGLTARATRAEVVLLCELVLEATDVGYLRRQFDLLAGIQHAGMASSVSWSAWAAAEPGSTMSWDDPGDRLLDLCCLLLRRT